MFIDTIVLSGGGYKGYIHLGVLNVLLDEINFDDIKIFAGTSVGALVNFLICLRCDPKKIMGCLVDNDRLHSKSINPFDIMTKFGVVDMTTLQEKVSTLIDEEELFITFEDLLAKTGKHFMCVANNLDQCKAEYFSPETTPTLRCIDAILASCCLPGIFQSRRVGGKLCVDGGSVDNFPYDYACDYGKRLISGYIGVKFGVVIVTKVEGDVSNFIDFLYRLLIVPMHTKNIKYERNPDILFVEDQGITDKHDLFSLGMLVSQKYILQI